MSYRTRKEVEAENLVLIGKLETLRDELDEFLGEDEVEEDEDDDDDTPLDADDSDDDDDDFESQAEINGVR
jgi:hypothetical protein